MCPMSLYFTWNQLFFSSQKNIHAPWILGLAGVLKVLMLENVVRKLFDTIIHPWPRLKTECIIFMLATFWTRWANMFESLISSIQFDHLLKQIGIVWYSMRAISQNMCMNVRGCQVDFGFSITCLYKIDWPTGPATWNLYWSCLKFTDPGPAAQRLNRSLCRIRTSYANG